MQSAGGEAKLGFLFPTWPGTPRAGAPPETVEVVVLDIAILAIGLAFFVASIAYVYLRDQF
jgi:hypothetical protein